MGKPWRHFRDEEEFDDAVQLAKHFLDLDSQTFGEKTSQLIRRVYAHLEKSESHEDYAAALHECIFFSGVGWAYWDGLLGIAQDKLRSGREIPRELALWIADVLEGKRKRPRKSGKYKSLAKHTSVAWTVKVLVEDLGVKATRGDETGGPQCCFEGGSVLDAVGVAANIYGYSDMRRIWFKCKQQSPSAFHATYPTQKRMLPPRSARTNTNSNDT